MLYTGNEKLVLNGKELPYTMLDFWRSNLSSILLNMTRGSFAEFLVQCAFMIAGYDALHQDKTGIEAWDIDGPTIKVDGVVRRSRIEVKSAASVQIDTPDSKEPISLPDTQLRFSIREAIDWQHTEVGPRRHCDLYVFCHYAAQYKSANMLDLSFWTFYLYPKKSIESNDSLKKQKTISTWRLKKLGVEPVKFDQLYDAMISSLKEISEPLPGFNC